MIYLCCDTNIWINISNSYEPPRLLDRLYDEIHDGNLILVVPEIIISEWDRNKNEFIIEKINKQTKEQIDGLNNLHVFLERREGFIHDEFSFIHDEVNKEDSENTTELSIKIASLIKDLKTHRSQIIAKAKKNIELVEAIFNHHSTVKLPTDENTSKIIVQLAIEHKFPFENKKNNFADCLIFYQYFNYLKSNNIEKAHFVTSNKAEFFPNGKLHEQYQKEIDTTNSIFHKSLSEALNKSLNEQLVSEREFKLMEEMKWYEDLELNLDECKNCGENIFREDNIEIVDDREYPDPNQLNLFSSEIELLMNSPIEQTDCLICDECKTVHVSCPECGDVWAFCENNYSQDEPQKCDKCNTLFIFHSYTVHKNYIKFQTQITHAYIELLNPEGRCEECGHEYLTDEDDSVYCRNCDNNDYYYY